MTETIISIVIWAAFAYWCYRIAQRNGRSEGLAIFMGFLFGICAVIVYYIIGKTAELKSIELHEEIEKVIKTKE